MTGAPAVGRMRRGARRWSAVAVIVACAAATASVVAPSASSARPAGVRTASAAQAAPVEGWTVELGPEQRLLGPTGEGDNPYFSERRGGKLYGYFGTSRTREWRANNNTRLTRSRIILDRGAKGKFDDCGAWMVGTFQKLTKRHWIAFYHAEGSGPGTDYCDHYGDATVWRMAIAETTNGGRTWRRPNYPDNVILTGKGATKNRGRTNAGNGRVVKVSDGSGPLVDYYYMFFETAHGRRPGPPGVHIARSRISDRGRPGTWKKYYCSSLDVCGFTERGIGGQSTPVGGLTEKARHVVWNSPLNRWVGFDASGKRGFRLIMSEVGVGQTVAQRQTSALFGSDGVAHRWITTADIYPRVSSLTDKYVDQWGGDIRDRRSKQLYAYPSIVGAQGQSCCAGTSFYVYYVKLFPGEKFDERYLMRRKVTLHPAGAGLHRVALTTYANRKDGRRRTTTELPKQKSYRPRTQIGYLLGHDRAGWSDVIECVKRGRYRLRIDGCGAGEKPYRRVGWIRKTEGDSATVPIRLCYKRSKKNYFATDAATCGDGARRKGLLGYALPPL